MAENIQSWERQRQDGVFVPPGIRRNPYAGITHTDTGNISEISDLTAAGEKIFFKA